MTPNFYTILTNIGIAKLANAQVTQQPLVISHYAVGDSNGAYYNPTSNQTALAHEVWRGPVDKVSIDAENANWINIDASIPPATGGFTVREIGIYDTGGDLIAIGKVPEYYKPIIEQGSTLDARLRTRIVVSNTASITLRLDPNIVTASRAYVDEKVAEISGAASDVQEALTTHLAESNQQFYRLSKQANTAQREVAYLKLIQEASERIEGGNLFAEDFSGNGFGITFNQSESTNANIKNGGIVMSETNETNHSVTDATVINQAYSTEGNCGRKLVRLSIGWLVAITKGSDLYVRVYVSKDNGATWNEDLTASQNIGGNSINFISLAAKGNIIYILTGYYNSSINLRIVDIANSVVISSGSLAGSESSLGEGTLTINPQGTEIHAAWSSKNSTYSISFNIRYAKGVINNDGSATWGITEQLTSVNASGYNMKNPTVVVNSNGNAVAICEESAGSNQGNVIIAFSKSIPAANSHMGNPTEGWGNRLVYNGTTYAQSTPSSVVDKDGVIHVTWSGHTGNNALDILYSKSVDSGITWSTALNLTTSTSTNNKYTPSITVGHDNKLYIVYHGYYNNPNGYGIWVIENHNNTTWSTARLVKDVGAISGQYTHLSTLSDLSISFTEPLFIYRDISKIGFYGSWTAETSTPITAATAVFDIEGDTDFVGAFIQKQGNVSVQAYLNNTLMDSELDDNEYQFTKQLPSEAPAKLRLELLRANTTNGNNDKITRILGGIA